jgi:recombinational DNA repair protein (RecF pathway)
MAILDIVQHSLQPGDPHPEFYDAAVSGLRALAVAGKEREAVLAVLWRALVETGHAPQLSIDIRSGESLADVPVYGFWPGLGGFSVETTPPSLMAEPNLQTVWKVRRETLHFLRGETPIVDPEAATDTTRRAMQLLLAYFRWIFSDEVRALTQFVALTAPTP